jgi:DHA1 family bicyclomycin/chloramphenicol resistance-like MFS transporter
MPTTPHPGMGFKEFVGFVAALMATNALAIDSMLPALQQIGTALGVTDANEKQWIITSYLLGFGIAQLFYGTLIDRYGRKPVMLWGMAGYVAFSLAVAFATSFEFILIGRAMQGIAAAVSRVVSTSIVRDCYAGRLMARVMSLAFIVFLGAFGFAVLVWAALRLPETLHEANRTPIALRTVIRTFGVIFTTRLFVGYTLAMTMIFGSLVGFINSSQQIFLYVFKEPLFFTAIFAIIAGSIAVASLLNARLVEKLGMRMLSHAALLGFIAIAAIHTAIAIAGFETIWTFAILQSAMMFCFGLLVGNFGAIAMEPLGHIAGTTASVQGFISMVLGALIGFLIGQSYNGTDIPLTLGFVAAGMLTLAIVLVTENGKLFSRNADLSSVEIIAMH